ncbi:MAG: hypothetical protein V4857_09935 [Pseudomonadota bacterium]
MSRYLFTLAEPEDDAQLRARMAQDWMDGDIAVSFRREPNYFAGCRLQGDMAQVIVCRDIARDKIVGLGSRCSSTMYIDGKPTRAGYLADLRGDPEYRKGTLLARGYRLLRNLHEDDLLPVYYTVIYDTNAVALRNLVGGRAGLPSYVPMGRILTPALHLDMRKPALALPGVQLRRARGDELGAIVAFLNRQLSSRQFAPVYREQDFLASGRCSGLGAEDFFLALRDGEIVGTIAAWDQAAIRQTHIERYSRTLRLLRPFYQIASALSPLKPLPPVGSRIPHLYLCCIAIAGDALPLFRALMRFAYNALRTGPWHYAIAGLHERDPLAPVLGEYRAIAAAGILHKVDFGSPFALDDRVPYIEMALA